ncbi:MAG: hypothetical protein ABI609_05410 [Acidobacteriota bacterium]
MSQPMVPPPAGGTVSQNRTVMIILSYLGLLALIPFLIEKDDKEVQWHAKHGLVLMVAEIALFIALSIVMTLLGFITHGFGCIGLFLWPIISLGILIVHILCIVKGVNGQRFLVPGVSQFADRF